jgi:hypothetical protein
MAVSAPMVVEQTKVDVGLVPSCTISARRSALETRARWLWLVLNFSVLSDDGLAIGVVDSLFFLTLAS